jgi:DNA-binding IclR family transcriptional regulator
LARPALSAERTVAILDFLAAHPLESFTLSELAARLDINKASAHAVLSTLTAAGYLVRHPNHKTYELGPALVAVGHAALERHRAIDVARDEIRRLSERLDAEVVASVVVGEEIVIVARAGRSGTGRLWVGARLPLVPPLGTVFLAWSGDATIEAWLRRVGPSVTDADLDRYRRAVAAVRERGYSVALEAEARERLGQVLAELADHPGPDLRAALDGAVDDLGHAVYNLVDEQVASTVGDDPAARAVVQNIVTPVFGRRGEVVLALTIDAFAEPLDVSDVPRYASALLRSARAVTAATRGRAPA